MATKVTAKITIGLNILVLCPDISETSAKAKTVAIKLAENKTRVATMAISYGTDTSLLI